MRQVEAVRKAYDSGTITADQVLEALRKQFTASVQYAKYVSELANDASQPYMTPSPNLVAAEKARRDTKKFWSELADRGAAQARNPSRQPSHKVFENLRERILPRIARGDEAPRRQLELQRLQRMVARQPGHRNRSASERPGPMPRPVSCGSSRSPIACRLEAMQKPIDARSSLRFRNEEKRAMEALETAQRQTQQRLAQMQALRDSLATDTEKLTTVRKSTEEEIRKIEAGLLEISERAAADAKKRATA